MRKKIISIIVACIILTTIGSENIFADSKKIEENSTPIYVGDEFPTFTQEDYDNNFEDYSYNKIKVSLKENNNNIQRYSQEKESNAVGMVMDEDTESPITDATIKIFESDTNKLVATVNSDKNGRFQIIGLEDNVYDWIVEKNGYQVAQYLKYDVCRGDIASIFSFYLSKGTTIKKICKNTNEQDISNSGENLNEAIYDIQSARSSSFSSAPKLKKFTVGKQKKQVERYQYLCYVVASEAMGYYQCTAKNMTDTQIKNYYAAQAVAANTMLEYVSAVSHKHASDGYTICDTTHCQRYDTTKTTKFVIDGVGTVCYRINGDWYSFIQVYKDNSKYKYIQGMYFAHCAGKTKTDSQDPSLKSVTCSDLNGPHTSISGHGKGLCQEGAAYKAKQGKSWQAILKYYYNSTTSLFCQHEK